MANDITINNDNISIENLTAEMLDFIKENLKYTDKSKQYKLRRMGRNPWMRASPAYEQLKSEVYGNLYEHDNLNNKVTISTCFLEMLKKQFNALNIIKDDRKETGKNIVLPWVKKPHTLRDYQEEAVSLMLANSRGLINLSTGLGKTLIATHVIQQYKKKALVVCPSDSIAKQFHEQFISCFGANKVGFYGGGKKKIADITVGIAASISKNIKEFKDAELGLLIMDECLPGNQHVLTDKGPIKIQQLALMYEKQQELPLVKSFNEKCKIFEYKNIIKTYRKKRDDLLAIKIGKQTFHCTDNHKILTSEGWISAGNLKIGDQLIGNNDPSKKENVYLPALGDHQLDVLIGSYFGDGHMGLLPSNYYRLSIIHGAKQEEYCRWKAKAMGRETHVRIIEKNGYKQKKAFRFSTKALDVPKHLKFSGGAKIEVSKSVLEMVNYRSLAVWFMDDGHMPKKGGSAKIATCSFSEKANKEIAIKLNNLGLECEAKFRVYKGIRAPGYWSIIFTKKGTHDLIEKIGPYIHKSMAYKMRFNSNVGNAVWDFSFQAYSYARVKYIKKIKNKNSPYVFDLEIKDNHNFIACGRYTKVGTIVHNCHHTPATTFTNIATSLANVGKIFGLTATDYRSDGKDIMITAGCGPILIERDIKWGVANGWLAEPYFVVREVSTGGRDFKDDKLKSYKEHVLNNQVMKDQIKNDAIKMMAAGKSVLILVDEVAHGKELSLQLGIPFATGIDSKSQEYVDQLNQGKVKGLVGTDGRIGEGTDTKNVDVLILANFIASKGAVLQCVGRALRKQGTKTKVIILDYIPVDSTMMNRHAHNRISFYEDITSNVKVI